MGYRLTEMTNYLLSCGDAQEQGKNVIAAFLWNQGECDSFENADLPSETKYETHKANLEEMFGDFTSAAETSRGRSCLRTG